MRKLLLLFMVLLYLCSCDDSASDGVVVSVKQCGQYDDHYDYTFKVYVNRLKPFAYIDGGQGYWLFTNDTLQIGDTIHIGKICKEQ